MNKNYLAALSQIVQDLNASIDENDHNRFVNLCAALQDFRNAYPEQNLDELQDKQQIIDMIPVIDTLIEKMESNKQKLAKEILVVRKSIKISKNQDDL
ncbi:hypothetical protein [Candidatus Berkiella aquae]|uniref:Uncharacterized protein n=1 Tax=Candidatus Berkiella aquae TaxID=295108 RepID=A0A0Q9YX49_9GAMM|nr:hypothetical protein [Candidatus Berkiella aquae]MCS5711433.1 hypothetical protein [Candidatus Berkiella aquae]